MGVLQWGQVGSYAFYMIVGVLNVSFQMGLTARHADKEFDTS